jgi:hypothetical protein
MGRFLVVLSDPRLGDRSDLFQALEEIGIEHCSPIRAVEPLDKGVLVRRAPLDDVDPVRGERDVDRVARRAYRDEESAIPRGTLVLTRARPVNRLLRRKGS